MARAAAKPRIEWPPAGKVDINATFIDRARREQRPGVPAVDVRDTGGAGLMLRVSPRTISWGWKAERLGRTVRLDLGPVDRLTILQARQVANEATELLRSGGGWPTETWLGRWLADKGIIALQEVFPDLVFSREAAPPKPRTWTFEQGVAAYLSAHEDEWRKPSHDDARKNLRHPILRRFQPLPLATLTPDDLALVLKKKSRKHHRMAEAIFVRLRHFFDWLASPGPRRESGVTKDAMAELPRPRPPASKEADDTEVAPSQQVRFPTMDRVGLLVALARTDLMKAPHPTMILLLASTVQRRQAICTARRSEFRAVEDGWGVWTLPPIRRKTGDKAKRQKRVQLHHAVPLPPAVWDAVRTHLEGHDSPWLFPALRAAKKGMPTRHLNPATLTHLLQALPVEASPHDLRRALRSHGRKVLKLSPAVLDTIIDHAEGIDAGSVSERHYVEDDRIDLKLPVIRAWWELVEQHASEAVFDLEAVRAAHLVAKAKQKGRTVKPRKAYGPRRKKAA